MATVQNLLDDINLRYRNTFSTDQKLVWMNEEQRELFEILELDSVPFSFSTVNKQYTYPIPDGVDKDRIKVITYQSDDSTTPCYIELPYLSNDNNVNADDSTFWWSTLENNFYLNLPDGPLDNRTVYIYLDQQPVDMVSTSLNVEPSVPVRYQELLKLGTLKRVAGARKDVVMRNNFDAEYQQKIADLEWKMTVQQPEWVQPTSPLPRRSQNVSTVNWW